MRSRADVMASRLNCVIASSFACAMADFTSSEGACANDHEPDSGTPLKVIVVVETTARLLAVMLDSGRNVINEHHVLFKERQKMEKDFTPDMFERQLLDVFRSRSGSDLRDVESARIPVRAKKLLKELVVVSTQVVAEAQPEINRRASGLQEFIPVILGSRVSTR